MRLVLFVATAESPCHIHLIFWYLFIRNLGSLKCRYHDMPCITAVNCIPIYWPSVTLSYYTLLTLPIFLLIKIDGWVGTRTQYPDYIIQLSTKSLFIKF